MSSLKCIDIVVSINLEGHDVTNKQFGESYVISTKQVTISEETVSLDRFKQLMRCNQELGLLLLG